MSVCVLFSKILLLQRAMEELEQETANRDDEKVKYLSEKLPPLQITGLQMEELQVSERYVKIMFLMKFESRQNQSLNTR